MSSFILLVSLMIISITTINALTIGRTYNKDVVASSILELEKAVIYSETVIYEGPLKVISEMFGGAYKQTEMESFINEEKISSTLIMDCHSSLQEILYKNQMINNIYIYNKEADKLIHSQYGYKHDASINQTSIDQLIPFTTLNNLATSSSNTIHYTQIQFKGKTETFILKKLPLWRHNGSFDGYIVFHMNMDLFNQRISEILRSSSRFMIINEKGKAIIGPYDLETSLDSQAYEKIVTKKTGDLIRLGNTRYTVTTTKSALSHWTYISLTPYTFHKLIKLYGLVILIAALLLVISSLVIKNTVKDAYQPIQQLHSKINDIIHHQDFEGPQQTEEIVEYLSRKLPDVQCTLEKHREYLYYTTVNEILYNHHLTLEDLEEKLTVLNIEFLHPHCLLMVVDINTYDLQELDYSEREYLYIKVQELLSKSLLIDDVTFVHLHHNHRIFYILNIDDHYLEIINQKLLHLIDRVKKSYFIQMNIALSDIRSRITDISDLTTPTLHQLDYQYIYDYGHLFSYGFVQDLESHHFNLTTEECLTIQNLMEVGKIDEVTTRIEEYGHKLIQEGCSYKSANSFLMRLFNIILGTARKKQAFNDNEKKEQLVKDFHQASTFKDGLNLALLILQIYGEIISDDAKNANTVLVDTICQYIQDHITDSLTLSDIAAHFNLSSSHLSRLFKSVKEVNFSSYITAHKLSYAKNRLENDANTPITKIAQEVGYYTPTYFTKIFKERYKMTPSQYRNLHGSNAN